jgi:REP-associated tyrosine transposase
MRWRARDYSLSGAYFITIVAAGRNCRFGAVRGPVVHLNEAGRTISECWESIESRFEDIRLGRFVVMPNHLHGILRIQPMPRSAPATPVVRTSRHEGAASFLSIAIEFFKSESTRRYAGGVRDSGWPRFDRVLWQRSYYDRVVRSPEEYERIQCYIDANPARWGTDPENLLNCLPEE